MIARGYIVDVDRGMGAEMEDSAAHALVQLHEALADVAIALSLFDAASNASAQDREIADGLDFNSRQAFEESGRVPIANGPPAVRIDDWPRDYIRRTPSLLAELFVTKLFAVGQLYKTVASAAANLDSDAYIGRWNSELGDTVTALRDSIAHADERLQGLQRKKDIDFQPVVNQIIHAPGGVNMRMLNGRTFGLTAADGHLRTIEVSGETVDVARQIVQALLDGLSYRGTVRSRHP